MKYFIILFGLFGLLFADMDVKGLITAIDNDKKTIVVNDSILIKILPQTKIKLDDCGLFGNDIYGKFTDLKVNSLVDVDVFVGSNQMDVMQTGKGIVYIAEEVELKCNRNSAY